MSRHSALTTLPRLTSQTHWVIDESLKEGHIQKSRCGGWTIFFEGGRYHVTGGEVKINVPFSMNGCRQNGHAYVPATLSFTYLPQARAYFNQNAYRYNYRLNSVTLPPEAILAKNA